MREDPHVAAEGRCLSRAEGRGCALRSCVRLGWRVGVSPALPLALARVGALHAWLGNLSPTLIGTNEGSYRQLMGKRATVILSERERGRAGGAEKVGGKVVAAPMQLISMTPLSPLGETYKIIT